MNGASAAYNARPRPTTMRPINTDPNSLTKRCTYCLSVFPRGLECFYSSSSRCKACHKAQRRLVSVPRVIPTSRVCGACKVEMPLTSEFFYKHPGDKAGYRHQCKPCGNMARKAWLKKNPAKHRSTRIKLVYGLDAFAHAELLSKQDGKCAVCLKPESDFKRRFAVDHDHKTGKVRGLLCGNCNTAIGLAKDDPELLNLLASYLRKQSGPIQTQGV